MDRLHAAGFIAVLRRVRLRVLILCEFGPANVCSRLAALGLCYPVLAVAW